LIVLHAVLFPRSLVWLICFVAGDSTSVEEVDVDRLSNERNAANNCILSVPNDQTKSTVLGEKEKKEKRS